MYQQQIDELNATVKCKLAPSKIHGIGVFAIRDIKKNEKLYCMPLVAMSRKWYSVPFIEFDKLLCEVRELIFERWPCVINGSMFLSPNDDVWIRLFMNHSEDPNYNPLIDCAIKDIAKGEEVTENYRMMPGAEEIYKFLTEKYAIQEQITNGVYVYPPSRTGAGVCA